MTSCTVRTYCMYIGHHLVILSHPRRSCLALSAVNSEYKTPWQSFVKGLLVGKYLITPAAASSSSSSASSSSSVEAVVVADVAVQRELVSQIRAGHLPAPSLDALGHPTSYYAVFFPAGITVTTTTSTTSTTASSSSSSSSSSSPYTLKSCDAEGDAGFCAFHGVVPANSSGYPTFFYGVHPDLHHGPNNGCMYGCGGRTGGGGGGGSGEPNLPSSFQRMSAVASHVLVDMLTDPEMGLGPGPGLDGSFGWYDYANGEVADICNGRPALYKARDGFAYTIQQVFSSVQNRCITYSN